ncbi:ADP-ribosylglycohydrolase [Neocallimastix lanati (nom. inval.)]|jgi:ADP-ribosylglycohydrolase|uniref:ADP-ribosylhydrolase ARH3 n=1 Tax=Neocallimastix californiae TaxID=1754190 RepID=A0A1Y2B410_9FUNG|nr:ADP-ribosylglycohydrolase [Neocallimastix sp. JGI-2020a]ORY29573.1 ADP-ribosylglycohydrolase [Neocallimastix californiae]|eukprot:ORY29573.1 ADP-ribosylglycohydrolase [Neocallimastix californiae]
MNKIKDGLYGFVVGDALGVPVEFCNRVFLRTKPIEEMTGYGTHKVPEGVWSDDTSMTLATMDSIIQKGVVDYNDIAEKFCSWLYNAKYTATNLVFDSGITTQKALNLYSKNKQDATQCGGKNIRDNGNGSLMRILPIAYYCYYKHLCDSEILEIVKNTSSITHAHEISIMGCYIYVHYVINLLNGKNKKDSYKAIQKMDYSMFQEETRKNYNRIIKQDISILKEDEIKSTGFVVYSLEASLWAILKNNKLKDTILMAINLGNDTDTIGAITGSLAGIIYSYNEIPKSWIEKLKNKELLDKLITNFCSVLR